MSFWNRFRKSRRRDYEVDAELRDHFLHLVEDNIKKGLPEEEARRRAHIAFGGMPQIKEATEEVSQLNFLQSVLRDIVTGVRALRRSKGFASIVIFTLALGIGSSVTMFSVMRAVLWRPLPYPNADRLVVVDRGIGGLWSDVIAPGEVLALRASSRTLDRLAVANGVSAFVTVGTEMERVAAASATDDFLLLIGAAPAALGRALNSAVDVRAGRVTGVMISDALWQRMLHRDPRAVGRYIDVNNMNVQIVGVLKPGVHTWLPASTGVERDVDVWFPTVLADSRGQGPLALATLAPGTTLKQAQAELDHFAKRFVADHPGAYANGFGDGIVRLRARPLRDVIAAPVERGLMALGGAVAFVLLIGCVNVANLMLARAKTREQEMAVRTALGAGRLRLIRQVLAEDLLLAAGGAAVGLFVARVGIGLLNWLRPVHLPRQSEISIDLTVVLVAIGVSIAATLVCGLIPAIRLAGAGGVRPLMSVRSPAAIARGRKLQRTLVVAEVALSIVPLVAAGLMLRSFVNLADVPLGFEPSRVLTARVPISLGKLPDFASRWALYRDAVERVRHLPGVQDVSAVMPLPFAPPLTVMRFRRDDDPTDQGFAAKQQTILPGYLGVMGTPLLKGRDITEADITTRNDVAIVDERLAQTVWAGDALGKRLRVGSGPSLHVLEVIGVTRTFRTAKVQDRAFPHVLVPYHIRPTELSLVVKTRGDMAAVAPALKQVVEQTGTARAVYDIRPMATYVAESINDTRFMMLVLAVFAIASLLLAAVGLYGTLAYLISQRNQEFGVRLALGASTRQIMGLVATEGATLTICGVAIGIAGAVAVTRTFASLLYGVRPIDTLTFAAVTGLLAIVAMVAVSRPAWHAAHLDPNLVLRAQ